MHANSYKFSVAVPNERFMHEAFYRAIYIASVVGRPAVSLFRTHYDAGFFPLVILLLPPEKIGHRRMYHRRMFLPVTYISQYAAITVLSSHLCSSIDLFDGIGFPASFGCEETEQFKSHTSAHVRTITTTTYCQRG